MGFIELKDLEKRELLPGFEVKFVHTDSMTFAFWEIKKGSELPEHSHIHEQVAQVVEGKFELTIENETQIVTPGTIAVIPSNKRHSGKAITDCKIVDVFNPVRQDYL